MFEFNNSGVSSYSPGKWDGGKDSRGYVRKPIWPTIARFMLANGLDPQVCIAMLFTRNRGRRAPLYPNAIATSTNLAVFEEATRNTAEEIRYKLLTESQVCRLEIAEAAELEGSRGPDLWQQVLLDDGLEFSPLFRFCVAVSEGIESVARDYLEEAIIQYLSNESAYNSEWGGWVPDWFKELATDARTAALARKT